MFPSGYSHCEGHKVRYGPIILGLFVCATQRVRRKYQQGSGSIRDHTRRLQFLQVFMWERFSSIAPKPVEINAVVIEVVTLANSSKMMKLSGA